MKVILFARLTLVTVASMLLAACGTDTIEWKEEVLLLDGRMIVIERKVKGETTGFLITQRHDLEFELHYKPMNVHWKGHVQQVAFEIIAGTPYIVQWSNNAAEFCKARPPTDLLIKVLKLQGQDWIEIPQSEFPMDRANYNLYQSYRGNKPSEDAKGLITWKHKGSWDSYPIPPGSHMSNNIPRRPYKLREYFEKSNSTCARFQQP
ncbi:hypothetical protein [Polaromonas sp. LjRoot131]|uniref:hypothetical protein n=1 Tax=Polaromonas sp. LjRoot131 TaxID=3342262 RepID=UPI003ECC50C7